MTDEFDLYEFPKDHIGRKTYVTVAGHDRSIPVAYTYMGPDRRYYLHPDFGGDWSGLGNGSSGMIMSDMGEYKSPIDNTMITSRSHHRDHMRRHEVIEVGNERMPSPRPEINLTRPGYDIKRAIEQLRSRG